MLGVFHFRTVPVAKTTMHDDEYYAWVLNYAVYVAQLMRGNLFRVHCHEYATGGMKEM
jgi:hypothetical protein